MQKRKTFALTRFSVETIQAALGKLALNPKDGLVTFVRYVEVDGADWRHDTDAEFFADYRRSHGSVLFEHSGSKRGLAVEIHSPPDTVIKVTGPGRADIESIFAIFEAHLPDSRIPPPPESRPTIFIGHGRSAAWRDLKDHLQDQHQYTVQAYEVGARAGHAIRDVLNELLDTASFAVLVMTGEDETAAGALQPRLNVVHEAGLFQGRLGFHRAIVVVENGVDTFSNIDGIQQIRFDRGHIRSTFGDVLATLGREFGSKSSA